MHQWPKTPTTYASHALALMQAAPMVGSNDASLGAHEHVPSERGRKWRIDGKTGVRTSHAHRARLRDQTERRKDNHGVTGSKADYRKLLRLPITQRHSGKLHRKDMQTISTSKVFTPISSDTKPASEPGEANIHTIPSKKVDPNNGTQCGACR